MQRPGQIRVPKPISSATLHPDREGTLPAPIRATTVKGVISADAQNHSGTELVVRYTDKPDALRFSERTVHIELRVWRAESSCASPALNPMCTMRFCPSSFGVPHRDGFRLAAGGGGDALGLYLSGEFQAT